MRKDVKRSLFLWPLAASLFVIALCFFAVQSQNLTQLFVAKAGNAVVSGALENSVAEPSNKARRATKNSLPPFESVASRINEAAAAEPVSPLPALPADSEIGDGLQGITAWLDAPVEIDSPEVAGIPAPKLDATSDLFGFDAIPVSGRSDWEEQTEPVDDSVEDLNYNDLVIDLDSELFADTDAVPEPIELIEPELGFQLVEPRLAERPTSEATRTNEYEAPAPALADLKRDPVPGLDQAAEQLPGQDAYEPSLSAQEFAPTVSPATEETPPSVDDASRATAKDSRKIADARWATWPTSKRLVEQLTILEELARSEPLTHFGATNRSESERSLTANDVVDWTREVRRLLAALHDQTRLGDDVVGGVLEQLTVMQQRGASEAETVASRSQRVAWLQAAYSLERRLAVWAPIYRINSGNFPSAQYVGDDAVSATAAISQLQQELVQTGDADGWRTFLLLDELQQSFESGDDGYRRELAQKFLSRLNWPNLAAIHREWLAGDSVTSVADAIRPWASGAVDYSALLHQIEKAESNAIDLVTAEVAQGMMSLRYANHQDARNLANAIDTHYRNANVRFSLSDRFLERLLPEIPTRTMPVRTTMLGSRISGVSDISTELGIRLIPSDRTWQLQLETRGQVATRSVGRAGPAAFRTSSINPFSASTPMTIKPSDIELGHASVDVVGRTRLRGVETRYDGWPLIGTLVRTIAENEYFDKASLSNRIARGRIQSQLSSELSTEINSKVDEVSSVFSDSVLGPLTALQLQPKVIDMQSTTDRLIARYRMAGDWQLAAMTPRPRAIAGNLFSVQIHQSALNNTLEQLVPQNQLMPIRDVLTGCYEVLGIDASKLPSDLPEDTSIQFAKHRPITIEIEDGRVFITMRVIRLERDRLRLKNFIVRAAYRPQFNGLEASLVRDGHLSISGPRMSMRQRLPVRTVFNKVLSPNRALPLSNGELLSQRCPEGTGVIQFELRDGWLGLAVGPQARSGAIARRPDGIR
ncbi:MAG: hypothetical protein AAFV88_10710 [Planctomycetota bacterium]